MKSPPTLAKYPKNLIKSITLLLGFSLLQAHSIARYHRSRPDLQLNHKQTHAL